MFKSQTVSSLSSRKTADALVLPFFSGAKPAFSPKGLPASYKIPINSKDFKGEKNEILCHFVQKNKEKRIIFVGLGKEYKLTAECIRRGYAKAVRSLKGNSKTVNIQPPELNELDGFAASVEGSLLANYIFDDLKTKKDKKVEKFTFIGGDARILKNLETIINCVHFTRDLSVGNADDVTPSFLASMANELARTNKSVKTTVLRRPQFKKENLALLEAVSRGSEQDPALIIMEYRGDPKSKELTALVGKGITYDTGGLNLKPTGGMETMRDDMSGAAVVLGTMRAAATLKLPINIVGVMASTENAIGPKSYKPGDVYHSHAGITVEIANTDAEGRLVLADALSYVQEKYRPKTVIDVATLTGGAVVALGEEVAALMSNDDQLSEKLIEAGQSTYERLWRLPLHDEYRELLDSKFADIKNSGSRKASCITAAIFLKEFIKKTKWAHIDIAGTSFPDQRKDYQPVQATGFGVRLLIEYLKNESA